MLRLPIETGGNDAHFLQGENAQQQSRTALTSHMEKRGSNKTVITGINNSCPAFE